MDFDEERKTSRVVVDTPQSRREVSQTVTTREPEKRGVSTGIVAAIVVAAVALTAIAFMFLTMNRDSSATTDQRVGLPTPAPAAPPQTTVIQPAAVPPTTIIQQAPPTQIPVVAPTAVPVTDDGMLQSNITNAIMNDGELSTADVQVAVLNGDVTLTGNVNSLELKRRAERTARSVKGIKKVDNQLFVVEGADTTKPQ